MRSRPPCIGRLFEKARRLARFDPLTDLYNHRALQMTLQEPLAEALTHSAPLSVIMLGIGHYRSFNETHGHDMGDRVLRMVAQAIRIEDFAARNGGEEFTIVLPRTPAEGASLIAERVRGAITAQRLSVNGQAITLTASLGRRRSPPMHRRRCRP
jgi:diguanylate cyclase (GGDEF)-like protein